MLYNVIEDGVVRFLEALAEQNVSVGSNVPPEVTQ